MEKDKAEIFASYGLLLIKFFICYLILVYTIQDSEIWIKGFIVGMFLATIIKI